ncbi:MAG: sigma-70 family RNA polymerase sigma factor [Vicinamibacterales bacterium]|nr:sigma-70 family RNA polymerase sigma factor [Vicinamibacterales bacterium]
MDGTDVDVVALVQRGNHEAFRILVERHSRAVFRVAYRLTGREEDAEDVVQETFLRAFRQIARFEARSSFATWLYRIAFNCAHDILRQRPKPGSRTSLDDEDERRRVDLADASPDADPAQVLAARRLGARLRQAMDELTSQERAAFVMRHYEGLSIEEIGRALDLGASAAKHSVFRAVRKLRVSLAQST